MVAASSHGLPPLWQIKPSDDGTTDHKEYASGTMPASIAGPDDEPEIILTTPYSVGANGVAALALPGLFQQEQVKPGNANLTALYSLWCTLGANGAAYLDLARVRVFASFYDYKEDRAVSLYGPSRLLSSAPTTSQMLSLAPATSQMLSSAPATTGITTPFFGDTGIRLLQFLVEFHPGGVPSHGLASRDEGHSAAAI